ncbi:hypothetical protein [Latilactobacillus sakei]|nr:hypothetical protein [Latilactobacillus sakei]
MIAIGGFDLSKADYRGMIPGIIATLIVIIGALSSLVYSIKLPVGPVGY